MKINTTYMRHDTPLVGVPPFGQVHAHSTGNANSTAKNEASFMSRNNLNNGFYTHVVGNGEVYQTAPTNRGAYDVGGGWNSWGYASVELIESHKTKDEFLTDYHIYVNLLRQLADEAGVPYTLDSGAIGIVTHDYCRRHQPNNGTDHVDPYPYLNKWGITESQFREDLKNGFTSAPAKTNVNNIVETLSKNVKGYTIYHGNGEAYPDTNIEPKTRWISNGIAVINGKPYYIVGRDMYLPQSSTTFTDKILINSDIPVHAVNSKGETVKTDLDGGSEWKYSGMVDISGIGWTYKIATDMYLPLKYAQGSGFKG